MSSAQNLDLFLTVHRQGVGVLVAIERTIIAFEETNQEFLIRTLTTIRDRLTKLFERMVQDQVRAIEDTKVKIKKRKGIIAFIRIFPNFSAAVENMLPGPEEFERLEVRGLVDEAYAKICKSMFESLKVIAKEGPGLGGQALGQDPEDKEALNYHILMIENMNHFFEEVDNRNDTVLTDWRERARAEMLEHLEFYVGAVVRRPLGKVLVCNQNARPVAYRN